jgi:hypothetical protein
MHLFAYPERRMMGLWNTDFGPSLGITPHPSRPGLYSEYPEAAQLHAITPDQSGFDLAENGIDGLFNVPVVQMRILLCDAHHQLRFDHEPFVLASPPSSGAHAATIVAVPKKSILDLGVNCAEPLLRSVGSLSIGRAFRFQFCNPIFGCAQLIGKLLSHAQRATAILFSNAGGLLNQSQYRFSCFVELVDVAQNVFRSGR